MTRRGYVRFWSGKRSGGWFKADARLRRVFRDGRFIPNFPAGEVRVRDIGVGPEPDADGVYTLFPVTKIEYRAANPAKVIQ